MDKRIIKFRAWDEADGLHRDSSIMSYDVSHKCDARSVMQFIGIKDRLGKEIYEGDILVVHQFVFDGGENEIEWCGEVVYISDFNCCGFGIKAKDGNFLLYNTGFDTFEELPPFTFSSLEGLHEDSFKVIGNVFENTELKKDKEDIMCYTDYIEYLEEKNILYTEEHNMLSRKHGALYTLVVAENVEDGGLELTS